jgi:hypothetical protein
MNTATSPLHSGLQLASPQSQLQSSEKKPASSWPQKQHPKKMQTTYSFPSSLASGISGINHRTVIYLSKEETSITLQKCKTAGVSATEAFHAGSVVAVAGLQAKTDHP